MMMNALKSMSLVALAGCLAVASGCRQVAESEEFADSARNENELIARINGEEIYREDFERFVAYARGELQEDPTPAPTKELFREFLTRKLLLKEAYREGVTVQTSEVERYRNEWTVAENEVDPDLDDFIYELLLTQKLLRTEVLQDIEVSLREMQSYYQQNYERFKVDDQVRVLEILAETRDQAEQIRSELPEADTRTFREKAAEISIGITAEAGGELGVFERGDLPEEFEKAIFGLKVGQVSEPFQSGHGFHLFLVEERVPAHDQKFYEVRQQIFAELTAGKEREAINEYFEKLFALASIEFTEQEFELDLQETPTNEQVSQ